MLTTVTSTTLLQGLKDENRTVWRDYVDRYRPMVVGYARRLGLRPADAEDVAQEAVLEFATAYRAGRYDRSRGRLRSWLFGITRTLVKNAHRRQRRRELQVRTEEGETDFFARLPDDAAMEELWEAEWQSAVLRQCMAEARAEVHARTWEAFDLFACQQLPASEVARRLGLSENAVFCAKQRVLRRIRELAAALEQVW
jgi:RNA polymerase sigma-70 factor (ECF subfamily)